MTPTVAIGIDLGGTNLKVAVVDRQGKILVKQTQPMHADRGPGEVAEAMVVAIDALLSQAARSKADLAGVGLGAPGPLSPHQGRIVKSANLPGWEDVPIRELLVRGVGCPVVLDNDANAAAFGEFWAGAGHGDEDLVMLTLGTGVGAGVVLGGKVLHGHFENAAELGHMIVVANGLPCSCGQRGCLEQYASASGVARRVIAAIESGESSCLANLPGDTDNIDAERVAAAAKDGDTVCQRIWEEACRYLAIACINIQHAFNPARVVLGGGMSQAGDFLLERVRIHLEQQKWSLHNDLPEVALATLGYDAGVIGAAGLVWQDA